MNLALDKLMHEKGRAKEVSRLRQKKKHHIYVKVISLCALLTHICYRDSARHMMELALILESSRCRYKSRFHNLQALGKLFRCSSVRNSSVR